MIRYSDIEQCRIIQHLYTCISWSTRAVLCNHTSILLEWPWRSQEEESKLASKPLLAESTHIPRVLGGSALVEAHGPDTCLIHCSVGMLQEGSLAKESKFTTLFKIPTCVHHTCVGGILSISLAFLEKRSFLNSFTFEIGVVFSYRTQVKRFNISNVGESSCNC